MYCETTTTLPPPTHRIRENIFQHPFPGSTSLHSSHLSAPPLLSPQVTVLVLSMRQQVMQGVWVRMYCFPSALLLTLVLCDSDLQCGSSSLYAGCVPLSNKEKLLLLWPGYSLFCPLFLCSHISFFLSLLHSFFLSHSHSFNSLLLLLSLFLSMFLHSLHIASPLVFLPLFQSQEFEHT